MLKSSLDWNLSMKKKLNIQMEATSSDSRKQMDEKWMQMFASSQRDNNLATWKKITTRNNTNALAFFSLFYFNRKLFLKISGWARDRKAIVSHF